MNNALQKRLLVSVLIALTVRGASAQDEYCQEPWTPIKTPSSTYEVGAVLENGQVRVGKIDVEMSEREPIAFPNTIRTSKDGSDHSLQFVIDVSKSSSTFSESRCAGGLFVHQRVTDAARNQLIRKAKRFAKGLGDKSAYYDVVLEVVFSDSVSWRLVGLDSSEFGVSVDASTLGKRVGLDFADAKVEKSRVSIHGDTTELSLKLVEPLPVMMIVERVLESDPLRKGLAVSISNMHVGKHTEFNYGVGADFVLENRGLGGYIGVHHQYLSTGLTRLEADRAEVHMVGIRAGLTKPLTRSVRARVGAGLFSTRVRANLDTRMPSTTASVAGEYEVEVQPFRFGVVVFVRGFWLVARHEKLDRSFSFNRPLTLGLRFKYAF